MIREIFTAVSLFVAVPTLAYAQAQTDSLVPTIPETQIKPAQLSSPYEFLSVATSADDFIIKASALAETNAGSADVKALAADLATSHKALMDGAVAAGKADKVEIGGASVDGEQKGLLGKLEGLKGADFDRAYIDAQIFVHQRTIAYYRGYSDKGNNLAAFASKSLPSIVASYSSLIAMGEKMGPADGKPAQSLSDEAGARSALKSEDRIGEMSYESQAEPSGNRKRA